MKPKLLLLPCLLLLFSSALFAQVPQMINFEGVARDNNGSPLVNVTIGLRFTILDSVNPGVAVYIERDTIHVNGFGLFSAFIGGGTPDSGNFKNINWATGNKYLQVELDPTGGTNYSNMGAYQFVSVPYAFYVDSAGKSSYPVHNIGDSYGGGIIFWTDSLGQHGLVADTADLDTGIVWNNGSFNLTNATRNGIGGGKANSERIIIKQGTGQYAAQLCADYQGGGYSDWYLPSVNELNLLYQQQAIVGGFVNETYWSSNELSTQEATAISFSGGGAFTPSNKTITNAVRAIRAF
jgi:hypothetical protein